MRWVGTSATWDRPLYEVSPPKLCSAAGTMAQRAGAHRAPAGPAVDALRTSAPRAGRPLDLASARGGSGRPRDRAAGLVVVRSGPDGAQRAGDRRAPHVIEPDRPCRRTVR